MRLLDVEQVAFEVDRHSVSWLPARTIPKRFRKNFEQAMATVGMANVIIEIGADPGRPAVSTHAVVAR